MMKSDKTYRSDPLKMVLLATTYLVINFVSNFLGMSRVCLQFVIVVFPDHTHLLFLVSFIIISLV